MKNKWFRGYINNRTKEIALAAIFTALYVVTRQLSIEIFPTVYLRPAGAFAYIPATFLPWSFTWLIPVIVAFTSEEPIGSFFALLAGVQVAYFVSRIIRKYKIISLVLAAYTGNMVAFYIRCLMGMIPFWVGIYPVIVKATITVVICIVLAPPIWVVLQRMGIMEND